MRMGKEDQFKNGHTPVDCSDRPSSAITPDIDRVRIEEDCHWTGKCDFEKTCVWRINLD